MEPLDSVQQGALYLRSGFLLGSETSARCKLPEFLHPSFICHYLSALARTAKRASEEDKKRMLFAVQICNLIC